VTSQTPANGSADLTDPHVMFDAFVNGKLPKDAWTHEAHVITCWVALQDRSPAETLAFLRDAIQTHNCGIGIRNTETSGYHETLTVYYITALANTSALTLNEAMSDPACGRKAPLQHWTRDVLFSTQARLGWVEPDVEPLQWRPVGPEAELEG
jgi:hypothetical protein